MSELFHLHSAQASIVIEHDPRRGPVWRHFGARVDPEGIPGLSETRGRATFALDDDMLLPVLASGGLGWFGPPALALRSLSGQDQLFAPGEFAIMQEGPWLRLNALDATAGISCELAIEALPGGAFRFSTALTNAGAQAIEVVALASAQVPLPASSRSIISWRGRHNAELVECREEMPQHRWERVTRRGISGHGGPPGLYVLAHDAGWHSGLAYALQLAWSGDGSVCVERDDEGFWTLAAAATALPGERILRAGETYRAPPAILAVSIEGRNGAMAQQHAAVRAMVQWPDGAMRPRPVHLNSWEACYFNHDAARIQGLARAAAALGVERFVLDDGWFKRRRNDRAGLGDWEPDPDAYPQGLAPLAEAVTALGMEFGLWVEPEMISPDSDLYRAHPDWALAAAGRERPTARHQLVIDMRSKAVRDHLLARLDAILSSAPISYLKWDQNRDHAPSGGEAQTLGTYELLARLRAAHPGVEIEGCAGGGGRSDAGLASYVHRFWTSDNIDAVSRVAIQRGFTAFLPPEMMGSHVGASPSHATGRTQALAFRAAIACMGHFGVELDPEGLEDSGRRELGRWIAFYKRWRDLLHGGDVHLGEGADGLLWQAQGTKDRKLLFAIRTRPPHDRRPQPLPLPFARTQRSWTVTLLEQAEQAGRAPPHAEIFARMAKEPVRLAGSWLSQAGLPLPAQGAESVAIFLLEGCA